MTTEDQKDQATTPETEADQTPAESTPTPPDGPPPTWDEVFQHERFKSLLKRAKEAEDALTKQQQAQDEAERKKLEEQAKWQELYEAEKAKTEQANQQIADLRQQATDDRKRRAIEAAARQHKPPFLESAIADVMVFADINEIEIDEDGAVKGAEAIVKDIAEQRPHWLDTKRQDPGSPPGRQPAPKDLSSQWSGKRITTL